MPRGGRRVGAGRKPGVKCLMDKEAAREALRAMVKAKLGPMVEAQMANAMGIKYLVARDKKTGKFRRLGEDALATLEAGDDEREVIEVWEKDPNVSAFTDLMNRTLDKPIEQVTADIRADVVYRWKDEE
jgi:hypothetical protein